MIFYVQYQYNNKYKHRTLMKMMDHIANGTKRPTFASVKLDFIESETNSMID